MSAVAATARNAGAGGSPLAGTRPLLGLALRRDRRRLAVWVAALGGLTVYSAQALATVYPTPADRQARAAVMANPAAVMLSGPGYGTAHYTLGAMLANELSLSVMVAASIMSIQLVVRHTRAEEEIGRAELVAAAAVGRRAPAAAAVGAALVANAALVAVVTAGLIGSGLAAADSVALAVGIGLTGLVFAAVAMVAAQLTEHARAASGTALALLAAAAVVRGVGEVLRHGGSALSWWSPLAWAQQTRAFVDLRWSPLLLSLALLAGLCALGAGLGGFRDLGAGLFRPRQGPAGAARLLAGPTGLTARLQRASIAAWAVALFLLGVVFGSLTDDVAGMVGTNPRLAAALGASGGAGLTESYRAAVALYLALGVGGFAVGSVLRLRGEETAGRVELLLACPLDRRRLLAGALLVTTAGCAALLAAAGLGAGVAAAAASGDPGLVGVQLGAQLVQLPAVLVTAGAAAALVGWFPRVATASWLLVAWAAVSGLFGPLLQLPDWLRRCSPFAWVPMGPGETLAVAPLVGLLLVAAVLAAAGLEGFRRRDVPA